MADIVTETPTIKNAELGYSFSKDELRRQCKAIYGAVAWPGKNPGFVVVVGMDKEKHFDSHDIYLLDEFESGDIYELVRRCGAFDYKYHPSLWIGNNRQQAADHFIRDMNKDFEPKKASWFKSNLPKKRPLNITPTPILDMKQPYTYMLPELKRLRSHKQLYLKDSASLNSLSGISGSGEEIPTLEIGDFPSIEALAFAVIEIRDRENRDNEYSDDSSNASLRYTPQSAFYG